MIWKQHYQQAHARDFEQRYPAAWRDGHYTPPVMPDVHKANGLTRAIVNYLNWMGHRATRINVTGRLVEAPERQASGNSIQVKKWLPSTTRKGTADISATVHGRSAMWEVKVGRDKPSEYQLAEQQREQRAGGKYFFVHDMDEFLEQYFSISSL